MRPSCLRLTGLMLALVVGTAGPTAGATAPKAQFRDTRGVRHSSSEWTGARAVVLFFIMPDCPISQSYVPEMNRIEQAYASKGVRFYAVQSDITASDADVRQHAGKFAYRFPVLFDPGQILVKHTHAGTTPESVVMSGDGSVLYRGRIDNRVVSFGTRRPQATSFDLRDALDAVLAGRAVAHPLTPTVGCIISTRTQ